MTTVIPVPPSLDEAAFEHVLEQLAPLPQDEKILIDARHTRWASPYGLCALLTLAQSRTERPAFTAPEADETASYWARAGFFRHAAELFELAYPGEHTHHLLCDGCGAVLTVGGSMLFAVALLPTVSRGSLDTARKGEYPELSMAETPASVPSRTPSSAVMSAAVMPMNSELRAP